jgi:hypothetical protein
MSAIASCVVDQITTTTDKKFEPVARMADAIIDIALQQGECLPLDLQAKGFSSNEVAALWHFAQAMAAIELKQMESKVPSFPQREFRYAQR